MSKKIFAIILISFFFRVVSAQNNSNQPTFKRHYSEEFRKKALKLFDWYGFEAAFGKKMHINMEESDDFFEYALAQNNVHMLLYFQQVQEGSITKENALQFWLDKLPYYESVYNTKYLAYNAQGKNTLDGVTSNSSGYKGTSGNVSPMTGGAICNNLDFSTNSTTGWVGAWANGHTTTKQKYGQTITACTNPLTAGFNSGGTNTMANVHEICTAGNDPHVPISRVPPGHTVSLRLGNDQAWANEDGASATPGYDHQSVKNTFAVTAQNNTIVYWYAAVFTQEKGLPHAQADQPYFKIRMYDASCNEILCAHYDVDATVASNGTVPGFLNKDSLNYDGFGDDETFIYNNWNQVFIPLINYTGTNVTLLFETSDCDAGGHFGYAYVAADCGPFSVISSSPYICGSTNVTLTAPGGAATYSWTAGGGGSIVSGANTPTLTVNHGGSYTVTMTTPGNSGATCTFSIDTVIPGNSTPPVAAFTATTSCASASINNTSTGGPFTKQIVNWGDGTIDSTAAGANYSPSHGYATPGTYTITLTVNNGCISTYSTTVTVIAGPVPLFSTTPVCLGTATVFTNSTAGATTYTWSYGDAANNTSNSTTGPTFTYPLAGTFTATLNVGSASGCVATYTNQVVVNPMPTATISAPPVCVGAATVFTSTVTNGNTYTWDFGDPVGSSVVSSATPSHTYASANTYAVTLTVTAVGPTNCSVTATTNVIVSVVPTASFSVAPVCMGTSSVFDATASTPAVGANYNWSFGGAAPNTDVVTSQTDNHTYTASGTFPVTLLVTVGTCSATVSGSAVVNPNATATISTTPVCLGAPTVFTGIITNGIGNTWNFGDGPAVAGPASPTHTYATAGTYIVSVTVAATGGCSVTATTTAIVNPVPTAAFNVAQVCQGTGSVFNNTSTLDSACAWNFGGAGNPASAASNCAPTYTYSASGTFPVNLTVTATGGCTATTTGSAIVNPMPVLSFNTVPACDQTPVCINNTTASQGTFTVWAWDFGDGGTDPTPAPPCHTYSAAGIYTITVTATTGTGCSGTVIATATVHPNPVFNGSFTEACLGGTSGVYDASTVTNPPGLNDAITTWNWSFGDTQTATTTVDSVNHVYATCGPFNLSYTVSTNFNCTASGGAVDSVYCLPTVVGPIDFSVCPGAATPVQTFTTTCANGGTPQAQWFQSLSTVNNTGAPPNFLNPGGIDQVPSYNAINPNLSCGLLTDTVFAIAVSGVGCVGNATFYIANVYPTPTVSPTNNITVCANAAVPAINFTGCPAPTETFSWTTTNTGSSIGLPPTGGGNIATFSGQNTTDIPAITEVDVTPWANGCSGPVSIFSITVNPIPTMTVTSPTPYCPGDIISSTTNGYQVNTDPVGGVVYAWTSTPNIGMPASGTGYAPNTPYNAPVNATQTNIVGIVTYTPTLGVCIGLPVTETVTIKPTPTMVAMNDQYWCPAANTTPVPFSTVPASAASTYTYSYNAGGGLSATGSLNPFPSLVTSNPGLSTLSTVVTVTPTLNGCVGPPSGFTIYVYPNPIAKFSSTNRVCEGQSMGFIDLSKPNTGSITVNTWAWDMNNDGNIDFSAQNPSYTYPVGSAGTNTVTLYIGTSSAPSCTAQVTEPIYINPNPVADFVGDSLKSCPTLHTKFSNLTTVLTPTTGLTYVWTFGNGNTSTATTPPQQTYTNSSATQSAYYNVTLTATTDSGCVNTKTKVKYIQVYPRPIADFSWGPVDADIDNSTITFVNEAIGASAYTPQTYGPNGVQYYLGDIYASNSNSNNHYGNNNIGDQFSHTYEHYDTATYYVTQWVINNLGCKDTITKPVHIGPNFTFYIPNAFSPNGDGTNEGFKGTGVGIDNTTYNLWVFDRWGLMIFYANDLEKTWDGHMNGNESRPMLQEDVYVWKVKFSDFTGKKHEYHGTVTLLK